MKYDITALGEILIDFTVVGEKDGNKLFQQNAGGAPANVVVASSKLGSNTTFLGKVGNDMHGIFLNDILIKNNVNIDGLILDENYFTTLAFVNIDKFKERSFSFARKPGADTQLTIDELNIDAIINSKILHVGSLSLTHEPIRSTTYYAIEMARNNNVIISYDPNYRADLWVNKEEAKLYMKSIIPDIMKVSEEETKLLTGENCCVEASKVLLNKGVKIIVVTLGEKGCYICNNEGGRFISGYKSNVIDTTGAGDSFWGAFLHKISASGINISLDLLSDFALFSNASASICVEKIGAIPAMPLNKDVLDRMK